MRVIFTFLILIGLARANSCNLKLLSFDVNKSINLTLQSDKKCKGYSVAIALKNGKSYNFYVNFSPKIVNQAPPFGFSLSDGKEFVSLGVDKNIIDSKLDAKLLEDSKIENAKGGFVTKWDIYIKELDSLQKIAAKNIEIKHMGKRECKMVYLHYLSKQRSKDVNIDAKRFINFCKKSWIINDKNLLLNQLFKVATKDLKDAKNRDILEFINDKPIKSSNKKSCKINIKLINSVNLKPISDRGFSFVVEKINDESYSKIYKKSSFELLKGSYGISVVGNRFSGQSQIINCDGGDYNVTIPLKPHI